MFRCLFYTLFDYKLFNLTLYPSLYTGINGYKNLTKSFITIIQVSKRDKIMAEIQNYLFYAVMKLFDTQANNPTSHNLIKVLMLLSQFIRKLHEDLYNKQPNVPFLPEKKNNPFLLNLHTLGFL